MLVEALALLLVGSILLRLSLRQARRDGLLTPSFWQTFWQFTPYRLKRLYGLPVGLGGLILLIWGTGLLLLWIRAYYAARLGHPLP
jgi:hypothetical protein